MRKLQNWRINYLHLENMRNVFLESNNMFSQWANIWKHCARWAVLLKSSWYRSKSRPITPSSLAGSFESMKPRCLNLGWNFNPNKDSTKKFNLCGRIFFLSLASIQRLPILENCSLRMFINRKWRRQSKLSANCNQI